MVALVVVGAIGADVRMYGQAPPQKLPTELSNIRFNSGQSVVPYFEGWIRNPDGTFDLVFGYFNRNWQQEIAIPAGPDNTVELGGPDAGQPTFFLPRRQRFVYRVRVPKDFGKKEVVWTLTANGRTEHAFGSLIREQEITERVVLTNGGYDGHAVAEIGDERAVHDVQVESRHPRVLQTANLPLQIAKIAH